jgi:hypothetical protein
MKTLVTKNIWLLAVGGAGVVAASGCGSNIDDCTVTRTCAVVAGAGGNAGSAAGGAGMSAAAGTSAAGIGAGTAGGGNHTGDAGAGEAAGAGAADGSGTGDTGAGGAAPGTSGCIDGAGHAQRGTTAAACGTDGNACKACATGLECKAGSCVCTAASCPGGCCSSDGECLAQSNAHCGLGGGSCASCDDGQRCDASTGACICDAKSCPKGCCDAAGSCVGYESESATQCGGAGSACAACSAGQACDASGTCVCTPDSCDGWCHGDTCEPFETLATNQPTFPATRGIALRDSDVYWTGSTSSDAAADKYRIQRLVAGGSVETLISNQPHTFGPLLLGSERLFVLNTDNGSIQSMEPGETGLDLQQTDASSFRYRSGRMYWSWTDVGRFTSLFVQSQDETDSSDVAMEFETTIGGGEIHDFAFVGAQIACGFNIPDDSGGFNYEIWIWFTSAYRVFPTRPGHLEELECDDAYNYYWRLSDSTNTGAALMMQNDGAPDATTIASDLDVTDFTLVHPAFEDTLVYYAYTDASHQTSGLRLYDPASSKTYDVVTGTRVGSLIADDTYLYFFEGTGHRLVRTPLPHVVLGLGK